MINRFLTLIFLGLFATATMAPPMVKPAPVLPVAANADNAEQVGIFDRLRARRQAREFFVVEDPPAAQPVPPPAPAPQPVGPPAKPPPRNKKGGIDLKTGKPFHRGLTPTPKHILAAAPRFKPTAPMVPTQYAVVPSKLSMWGNDKYGDCVTAEEAYKCACSGVFISEAEVIRWAQANGVLDGANLQPVIQQMQSKGFSQDGNLYNDGKESVVDYSHEPTLRAAIAQGVVKLGLDANALPSGAGNQQGWYDFGGTPGEYSNEDHSTALSAFGTAQFCFDSLHLPVPAGVDPAKPDCYVFFTWSTCGVVDFPWIQSTVGEAWVRNPGTVTVGTGTPTPDPPLTPPVPPPPPPPPPPPVVGDIVITVPGGTTPGTYVIGEGGLSDADKAALQAAQDAIAKILGNDATRLPPPGWTSDTRLAGALSDAMKRQGGNAAASYARVAHDKQAHQFLLRSVHRHMSRDADGRALLDQYSKGALPPGWLQGFLDWLLKNGPAILSFIMEIMKLFGL